MNTLINAWLVAWRPRNSSRVWKTGLALAAFFLPGLTVCGATFYWTGGGSNGNWSTTATDINWATSSDTSPSTSWTNENAAEIVTANPELHLWTVSATTLNISNGLTLYASGTGTGSLSRGLTISEGGSGNLTLRDDRAVGGTSLGVHLNGTSAWDGTITVQGSTTSDVFLTIGNAVGSGTGSTGTATKVLLVDGGTLKIGAGSVDGVATIGELAGSGTVRLHGTFNATRGTRTLRVDQATDTTFSGTLGGSYNYDRNNNILAFTKAGTGTLVIHGGTGVSGYEGTTTVEGGSLFLTGTFGSGLGQYVTGQGDYLVKSGALLGVDGTLSLSTGSTARNVTIESGGTLKPGGADTVGTLTLAGGNGSSSGLVFEDNARIEFRLGATQDHIELTAASMTGSASGGEGSILFDFIDNGGVLAGSTYDLISFGGTTPGIVLSTFALSTGSIAAGWEGVFSYGGDGNLLQFIVTAAPIPEPATAAALAALGCLALTAARRRRSRNLP